MPTPKVMGDKEILNDCLTSEKNCTNVYNTFANECVNPQLRTDFLNTLKDAHDIQTELFNDMQTRGWYTVKGAKQEDIVQAAQKYGPSS
ncbi:MAG: spore coat protein [Clostridiales bacterium]|jgi:spore coat protein CotF|nr:spore coat protein [Clostridiales bacterium]